MKSPVQAECADTDEVEPESEPQLLESWLHRLAISFAGVCGIHCLLTPALLILFPIMGSTFFADERFHVWMLFAVIPTTVVAITLGCRRHKDKMVMLLSSVGLAMITVAAIWGFGRELHTPLVEGHLHVEGEVCEHDHAHEHSSWATWLTLLGGITVVAGHVRNYRLCRTDHCNHCEHD